MAHSSQLGRYQFHLHKSFINAGTITHRTMVASTKMAMPKPKPICCKQIIDTVENPRNTATMIRAVQ